MACAEPDGESAQLLSCLSHQLQIRLAVMGLSAHMEPADDGIGVRAVKLPVSVQDVQDSVVGATGNQDALSFLFQDQVLFVAKCVLFESVSLFEHQLTVAQGPQPSASHAAEQKQLTVDSPVPVHPFNPGQFPDSRV